jgi:hypothetical protein
MHGSSSFWSPSYIQKNCHVDEKHCQLLPDSMNFMQIRGNASGMACLALEGLEQPTSLRDIVYKVRSGTATKPV